MTISINPGSGQTVSTQTCGTAAGTAASTAAGTAVCQSGQTLTFTATPVNAGSDTSDLVYFWSFGDNTVANGQQVTHSYQQPGTYAVSVFVQGNNRSASATTTVTIQQALQITANIPSQGVLNQAVNFSVAATAGATLPSDTTYSWSFGDGDTGAGPSVSHVYSTTGTYTVTVTATSASTGRSGSVSQNIVISNQAPTISVSIVNAPSQASTGQTVTFTASSTGNVPSDVVYTWNFGDGTMTTTGPSVTHMFTTPGTYTVTVSASSASNTSLSGTASTTIVIVASGPSVTYTAGWNQVAGPAGMTFPQCSGPLYTFQAGDTAYEAISNTTGVASGLGYWCYLSAPTTITLVGTGTTTASVVAPAGQWVEVGNPSATTSVTVKGADAVVTYNQATNSYVPVTTLAPGKGAWAISLSGTTLTISP